MHNEQVFTPADIVTIMLDHVKYIPQEGDKYGICRKHIIDNSCGDGNFLVEIVRRFIAQGRLNGMDDQSIINGLETYVHGIEIEPKLVFECRCRLDQAAKELGLENIKWDIVTADALTVDKYDGKMDLVVGNPPYTRIQHFTQDRKRLIRSKGFAGYGSADLYFAFFSIGLAMLSNKGILSYITPSSWINNTAGKPFRKHLLSNPILYSVMDLTTRKVFDADVYTMITTLVKGMETKEFWYWQWTDDGFTEPAKYKLEECVHNEQFIFNPDEVKVLNTHYQMRGRDGEFHVKNGFATLDDNAFISDYINFESNHVIDIIKASTAKKSKAVFPYTPEGDPVPFPELDMETKRWLTQRIKKDKRKTNPLTWWLYGKPQALRDVCKNKFTLNQLVATTSDIKIEEAPAGCGVYSGFYILAPDGVAKSDLEKVLATDEFVEYVKLVGKPKSSGYVSFSCLDVEKYLNQKFSTC